MKCSYPVRSRSVSIALPIVAGCIVISAPPKPVYGRDVKQLQARARQGHIAEQIELVEAYLTGKGIRQSAADAPYWYERAVQNGNPEAQNMVGYMYQTGLGVQVNAAGGVHWYELAAASGCSDAMLSLEVLHIIGSGVQKDPSRELPGGAWELAGIDSAGRLCTKRHRDARGEDSRVLPPAGCTTPGWCRGE